MLDSENTFIFAVAVIAAIVFIIVLIAAFAILRAESRINKVRQEGEPIPDSVPSVAAVATFPSESLEANVASAPPAENLVGVSPGDTAKDELENEPIPDPAPVTEVPERLPEKPLESQVASVSYAKELVDVLSVEETKQGSESSLIREASPASKPQELQSIEPNVKDVGIRLTWSVWLAAGLISALHPAMYNIDLTGILLQDFDDPYGFRWFSSLAIGTAATGAISIRIVQLSWRQLTLAALFAGVILLIAAQFVTSRVFLNDLSSLVVIPGGIFLLALFDPAVRKGGPAPSLWKVTLAALFLSLLITRSDLYLPLFWYLIPAGIGYGILLGLTLSLSAEKNIEHGAWIGGLSILIPIFTVAMLLLGF
jgi:hypothetical protein